MCDQASLPWFAELNRGLCDALDEETFPARVKENARVLNVPVREIVDRALARCPAVNAEEVMRLLSGPGESKTGSLLFADAA